MGSQRALPGFKSKGAREEGNKYLSSYLLLGRFKGSVVNSFATPSDGFSSVCVR